MLKNECNALVFNAWDSFLQLVAECLIYENFTTNQEILRQATTFVDKMRIGNDSDMKSNSFKEAFVSISSNSQSKIN